jgi:Fur family transcriptional regulator, ferric uptake regulator
MILVRMTKQKRLIAEELETFDSFFSADDLHRRVNQKDPSVAKATVYRYLKDLRDSNHLHSYLCDRRLVYSKKHSNHSHFTCQQCGRVVHFDVDSIDFLKGKVPGSICHFLIDVSGICDECTNVEGPCPH